ncbi:G-protein coupled receptor B0563.6 [Mizuhopecten yessoensis]|uniref:G-protein coupled receptor B0563.6 n=1 Tax=Mizuhopecten yessoensis TaxID=6573 RepID=A0A210Q082_MIZYE|nr:G-protein coupled receptor B0563.6 [Mizuhopecten yessoensis]
MAPLKSCENADEELCSVQQNWTWSHYNVCSVILEEAQLEFTESDLVCYFVKLAMFLVNFCSQLTTQKLDYMHCFKRFGVSAGLCSSVFPDLKSEPFLYCFNTIVENVGERQNESDTDWFHHIHNVLCSNKSTSNIGICTETVVLNTVFNIKWYASSETAIMTYRYVFPAVGVLVIVINLIMLIVMLRIISNDSLKLLLCTISVCEILAVITICYLFLGVLTTDRYHDYILYGWCIIILCIFDIVTPLFHAMSNWLTLGLAIQRYLIIKYPFKARSYEGKKSRNLVLLYMTITMLLTSTSLIPQMMCIAKTKQWPIMSKIDITKEIVTAAVPQDMAHVKLKSTAYTLRGILTQIIPTLLLIIFEIALLKALHNQRANRNKLTNNSPANQQNRLIDLLTSIIVMTILVSEIPITIVTFLAISGYATDLQNSMPLLNVLPLMLHTLNLVMCCGIAKDFRDKLFECVRKFTKSQETKRNTILTILNTVQKIKQSDIKIYLRDGLSNIKIQITPLLDGLSVLTASNPINIHRVEYYIT